MFFIIFEKNKNEINEKLLSKKYVKTIKPQLLKFFLFNSAHCLNTETICRRITIVVLPLYNKWFSEIVLHVKRSRIESYTVVKSFTTRVVSEKNLVINHL